MRLLGQFQLRNREFLFAIGFFDRAFGFDRFGTAAPVFVEPFAQFIIRQVVGLGLSILALDLDGILTLIRLFQRAFGAFPLAFQGDLFGFLILGESRESQGDSKQREGKGFMVK